jgi:hypothetical protein
MGTLFKLSWAQNLQKQRVFQGTWKPRQTMINANLVLNLSTKHENQI